MTPDLHPLPIAISIALAMLLAALLLGIVRVWRGPTTADRVIALDTLSYLAVAWCALHALRYDEPLLLRPALPLALLAFLGTVAFARYLEKRAVRRWERR